MANYQAARARRVDRDFRYHPEASEYFLILPSSFPFVRSEEGEPKEVTLATASSSGRFCPRLGKREMQEKGLTPIFT